MLPPSMLNILNKFHIIHTKPRMPGQTRRNLVRDAALFENDVLFH